MSGSRVALNQTVNLSLLAKQSRAKRRSIACMIMTARRRKKRERSSKLKLSRKSSKKLLQLFFPQIETRRKRVVSCN